MNGFASLVALADQLRPAVQDDRPEWIKRLATPPDDVALYYRFLYGLAKVLAAPFIVELGTWMGASAAHFALGNPKSKVFTIDREPQAIARVSSLGIPNVTAVLSDSIAAAERVRTEAPIDVLFIDSEHTLKQAKSEYDTYRPLVRDGGLILVDDIRINPELEKFWLDVDDPKIELNHLHHTGFGVIVKSSVPKAGGGPKYKL